MTQSPKISSSRAKSINLPALAHPLGIGSRRPERSVPPRGAVWQNGVMTGATALPAAPSAPALERGRGAAEIAFARDAAGATRLAHLYQQAPCRVLFPRPEPGDPPLAALLTTSGGLTGGDAVRIAIAWQPGAAATITTAAAEKIYRSLGPDARASVALRLAEEACGEWLPQETILFDGARLCRRLIFDLAPSARLLACETLVFGRAARGERLTRGRLFESWAVRRDGRLIWADALVLDGDIRARLDDPHAFGGGAAFATALYAGPEAAALLETARACADGAASLVGGVLLARFLGADAAAVRRALAACLSDLRRALGRRADLPRLWTL
jgi:urease accessory protein